MRCWATSPQVLLGPWGLAVIGEVESTLAIAEFGVVLLLFLVGLELDPARLWALRGPVFGLGGAQVGLTAIALAACAWALGLSWQVALVAGFACALSSTALVLASLAERGQLATQHGRRSFAVLLFQDLAVVPLLALLPLLGSEAAHAGAHWTSAAKGIAAIAGSSSRGRLVVRPALKFIASHSSRDVFTAAALLLVIGAALLMEKIGLSMSLGAFLAGVLLADSEFRHELEADIEPFKGLLLGLFFVAVGMEREPRAAEGGAAFRPRPRARPDGREMRGDATPSHAPMAQRTRPPSGSPSRSPRAENSRSCCSPPRSGSACSTARPWNCW